MKKSTHNLEFKDFKNNKYFGKPIWSFSDLGLNYDDTRQKFKINLSMIAMQKNADGIIQYGSIGEGRTWFYCFLMGNGAWCFNPLDVSELEFSHVYQAWVYKKRTPIMQYFGLKPGMFIEVDIETGQVFSGSGHFKHPTNKQFYESGRI